MVTIGWLSTRTVSVRPLIFPEIPSSAAWYRGQFEKTSGGPNTIARNSFFSQRTVTTTYCCHSTLSEFHYNDQQMAVNAALARLDPLQFEYINQSIKTRDAQASLRHRDRCLRCDGRPSTSVICNAEQWWHGLARPLVDVVLTRFTRSTSATPSVHEAMLYDLRRRIMETDMTEPWYVTCDAWRLTAEAPT